MCRKEGVLIGGYRFEEKQIDRIWRRLKPKSVAGKPLQMVEVYLKYGTVCMKHEAHFCPRCKNVLNAGPCYQPKYCSQCGQKLNFSGVEWKEDEKLEGIHVLSNMQEVLSGLKLLEPVEDTAVRAGDCDG